MRLLAIIAVVVPSTSLQVFKSWIEHPWCESVFDAHWPFEVAKQVADAFETKGRVTSNRRNLGHVCATRGAESKCHRCEDIACGGSLSDVCQLQVQGVDWSQLHPNVMALWDVPWAVGGSHRNDFQGGSHACLMLQGGDCLQVARNDVDFRTCKIRCVGYSNFQPSPKTFKLQEPDPIENSRQETVGWEWPESEYATRPQGKVTVVAGEGGTPGYLDGAAEDALFNSPSAIAVDAYRNIYVADTGNHVIRKIEASTGVVTTIAGTPGTPGMQDGTSALFRSPQGITLYYDWGIKYDSRTGSAVSNGVGELVLVVSDTENHRLRRIVLPGDGTVPASIAVETLAGGLGLNPEAGYSDGDSIESRFNLPIGVAADDSGIVFVADSSNHLIRRVHPNGDVFTLAGTLVPIHAFTSVNNTDSENIIEASCRPPCLTGSPGSNDGTLKNSSFTFPSGIAIGPENTILVVDGNRIRRVTRNGTTSEIQGQTFEDSVVTVAGSHDASTGGSRDGIGNEATFNAPRGIVMDSESGRVFVSDSSSCRLRRITPSEQVAKPIDCSSTLLDIIRPSGCASYDPPVDSMWLKSTDIASNIHYNYKNRSEFGFKAEWINGRKGFYGRMIRNCQGTPPMRNGFGLTGDTLGSRSDTTFESVDVDEDTDEGTAIYVRCPVASCTVGSLRGNSTYYADDSQLCVAAEHAGILTVGAGGLIRVIVGPGIISAISGSVYNGITSMDLTGGWPRTFSVEKYLVSQVQVATIAGAPGAPLEEACGMPDRSASYELPLRAHFNLPGGIAMARNASLSSTNSLYIADTGNHVIRAITAACAKVCENGGTCDGDETCVCASGWSGDDCTVPICTSPCASTRQLCVAPDTCDCVPGYGGDCTHALCVQTCENGGVCSEPDTCHCAQGWMDSNCTTPVCSQTCGNGANCTSPDYCNCPMDWMGSDCRTPVCRQPCHNGGNCTAPDTCTCFPEWSGHDCSLPVCIQGFLQPDPSSYAGSASGVSNRKSDFLNRPYADTEVVSAEEADGTMWRMYVPCDDDLWCNKTNSFDCAQEHRQKLHREAFRGPLWRQVTGLFDGDDSKVTSECIRIELSLGVRTPFPYERETADNNMTQPWRYTPSTPYGWNSFAQGPDTAAQWDENIRGWRASATSSSDRMIAHVRSAIVRQGVYACANGGSCTAPNTCECASGWMGFDCRIPICEQGYYMNPTNAGTVLLDELGLVPQVFPNQGLYECSIRSVTEWENEVYIHDHPNYYSRYMDHHPTEWSPNRYQLEPESPYYWDAMGWPSTHEHVDPDGNHTNQGWTRKGYWTKNSDARWKKGKCTIEYTRTCPVDHRKSLDVRTLLLGSAVDDTMSAYAAVVFHDDEKTVAVGRWFEKGGECIDVVHRGCKNNGTCVGPNVCECAPGWSGDDCTVPICNQRCSRPSNEDLGLNNNNLQIFSQGAGNCTLPDTCTCAKGWEGASCEIPICAQECNNNGKCTAPDTCTCARWYSTWRDNRLDGGRPLFQDDEGNPQLTGWTGYDCSTPICVQAKGFEKNINARGTGNLSLGGYGLILYGEEPVNNYNLPTTLSFPPYNAYTWSKDLDPQKIYSSMLREWNNDLWALPEVFLEETFRMCRMRGFDCCAKNSLCYEFSFPRDRGWGPGDGQIVNNNGRSYQSGCKLESERFSDYEEDRGQGYLCNVLEWEQGDYDTGRYIRQNNDATNFIHSSGVLTGLGLTWVRRNPLVGEGVYQCANFGSCIAPDECSCPDGFTGDDCNTPLCRHIQADGTLVSCVNAGVCGAKDSCKCPRTDSVLYQSYRKMKAGKTGYNGTDCSIPMCMQGTYDKTCRGDFAPGGEGCFRCKNGGNCTAPDFCTCTAEWTGYDCGTPVCTLRADEQTVIELQTSDILKIRDFELDPCQTSKTVWWNNYLVGQGNCTAPNICTCLCKERGYLDEKGEWTDLPWDDPLNRERPLGYVEGTLQCIDGFEGIKDNTTGNFKSCHLRIYIPKWYERYSITLIVLSAVLFLGMTISYLLMRRRMRQKYLLHKAERRLKEEETEVLAPRERKKTKAAAKAKATKKKRHTDRKVGKLD